MVGMVMSVAGFVMFGVVVSTVSMSMSVSVTMMRTCWVWVGIHLHCGWVFGCRSRFIGSNMSSESMFVGNVVHMSVDTMGILVSITSLDLPWSSSLFMSVLGIAPSIIDIISETIRLKVTMMVIMVIVMMVMMSSSATLDIYTQNNSKKKN